MIPTHVADGALFGAAEHGRTGEVAALLAGGADPNELVTDGCGVK
jgi:hypothetical protein